MLMKQLENKIIKLGNREPNKKGQPQIKDRAIKPNEKKRKAGIGLNFSRFQTENNNLVFIVVLKTTYKCCVLAMCQTPC